MVVVGLPCGLRVGDQVSDTREGLPETISEGACSFWERGWHAPVRRRKVFHRSLLLHASCALVEMVTCPQKGYSRLEMQRALIGRGVFKIW